MGYIEKELQRMRSVPPSLPAPILKQMFEKVFAEIQVAAQNPSVDQVRQVCRDEAWEVYESIPRENLVNTPSTQHAPQQAAGTASSQVNANPPVEEVQTTRAMQVHMQVPAQHGSSAIGDAPYILNPPGVGTPVPMNASAFNQIEPVAIMMLGEDQART